MSRIEAEIHWLEIDKAVDFILSVLAKDPQQAFEIREYERQYEYNHHNQAE